MIDESLLEIYRQLRTHQEKYIYFILATAASAIAYALNRAEGRSLTLILIPWGIALTLWGLSFYFGCRHLDRVEKIITLNIKGIEIGAGRNPDFGNNSVSIANTMKEVKEIIALETKKAYLLVKLQFWFFVAGILAYIFWQLIEMSIRSQ